MPGNDVKVSGMEHLSEDYKPHLTVSEKIKKMLLSLFLRGGNIYRKYSPLDLQKNILMNGA